MKLKRLLIVLLAVISSAAAILSLTACEAKVDKDGNVTITDGDKSGDNADNGSTETGGGNNGGSQSGLDGDEVVERIESPVMWEQMCFKPDRIKSK